MAISVTCPKCLTRFKVGDQHAGKSGPCPKCKTVIKIPDKADEVVIHAPESEAGAKDATGRNVLKPLKRKEAKFQLNAAAAVGVLTLLAIGMAFLAGRNGLSAEQLTWVKIVGAIVLGPPLAWAGYTFLRNDEELEPFRGLELAGRSLACGLVYALLWGIYWYVGYQFFGDETYNAGELEIFHVAILAGAAAGLGAVTALVSFDFELLTGLMHYALYFVVTVLLRLIMGASLLPGMGG